LAIYTLKSGEDLEPILDSLMQDKKIPGMDDESQDQVRGNADRRLNPNKPLDWKKEPPRLGASLGPGPRSPMKPRRDGSGLRSNSPFGHGNRNGSSIGQGNGPAHHFCQRCQNYTYSTQAETQHYLNKKHEVVSSLRTVFRNSISKSPSRVKMNGGLSKHSSR